MNNNQYQSPESFQAPIDSERIAETKRYNIQLAVYNARTSILNLHPQLRQEMEQYNDGPVDALSQTQAAVDNNPELEQHMQYLDSLQKEDMASARNSINDAQPTPSHEVQVGAPEMHAISAIDEAQAIVDQAVVLEDNVRGALDDYLSGTGGQY